MAAAVSVHATSPSAPHPKLVANERSILEKTEHPAKGERSYFCENQGPAAFFSNSSVGSGTQFGRQLLAAVLLDLILQDKLSSPERCWPQFSRR